MKIKRKEYERLQAIANTRLKIDSPTGVLINVTFAELYYITAMDTTGDENNWIHCPTKLTIIPAERASLPSESTIPIPGTDDVQKGM
jgi:hypothetical protein